MKAAYLTLYVVIAMYRRRWWEPVMVIIAVTIACAGLTAVSLINQGAERELTATTNSLYDFTYRVSAKENLKPLSKADYSALRLQGFTELVAYTRYSGRVLIGDSSAKEHDATIIAIDSLAGTQTNQNERSVFSGIPAPAMSGNIIWVGKNTLPDVPDDTALTIQGSAPLHLWRNEGLPEGVLITDLHTFYRPPLTLEAFPLSGLAVTGTISDDRVAQLRAALPQHLQLVAQSQPVQNNSLSKSFSLNLWAMGMLMVVVSLFIVLNALHLMYRARLANLLRLRQMGVSTTAIGIGLLLEMFILTLAGCVAGVFLGAKFTVWLNPVLNSVFDTILEARYLAINPVLWQITLRAWAISLIAVVLIMALPFWQLRHQLLIKQHTVKRKRNVLVPVTLIFVIISVTLAATANTQTSALLAIASTLLSGCLLTALLLPNLLGAIAKQLPPRYALLHWSMANAKSLTGRTRLAISAFVVALAANTGMNVMVDSFRQATEEWLAQRLVAPYYITNVGDTFNKTDVPAGIELFPRLAGSGSVSLNSTISEPVTFRSFPEDAQFRAGLALDSSIATPWQHFDNEQAIFINQQLSFRAGIRSGATVELVDDTGAKKTYLVAGVYPDYGNPSGQVLLPFKLMDSMPHTLNSIGARLKPGYSESSFRRWVSQTYSDAQVYSKRELYAGSMEQFNRTFIITDGLNLVTLLVAALSFLLSVALLAMDIRPQLSLLRTFGVGSGSIRLAMMFQYLLLCLGSALLALPFGVVLAWLLVEKVNRYAFFWTYPLIVDPLVILQSAAISVSLILLLLTLPISKLHGKVNTREMANV